MKYNLTLFLLAATISFSQAQKTINASDFSEISLKTSATVYVTQGNEYKVTIDGDEEDLEEMDVHVRGNTLVIDSDDDWSWFGNNRGDVTVEIITPKVEGISVSGSGKLYGKNTFKTNELDLSVSGSGKMEIESEVSSRTTTSISGSGKIRLAGSSSEMRATISGSGKIDAEDFKVKSCNVHISGSGSGTVYVEESLDAKISGSGSVYYGGNPTHVDSHTSGSGRVKKM